MKKIILLFFTVSFFFNCSSGGDSPSGPQTPVDDGKPIAVNDNVTTLEDTGLEIGNLLNNDTIVDNARINSIDTASANGGTVVDNRDGTYTYTPPNDFIGTDTFSYTICDDDDPKNCSTATVTIEVTDGGDPVAVDDTIEAVEDTVREISTLLDNDTIVDEAVLTSIDNSSTNGTVALNSDGSVTYTPQSGFTGDDTFMYTVCDDDSPANTCSTATVTITVYPKIVFNIPAALSAYYDDVGFSQISDFMFTELEDLTISKHITILSYGQRHQYLYDADEDENNTDNVILMYSGESRYWEEYSSGSNSYSPQTFNTEHVYPQSRLTADDAVTDLHHLRACDATVNGSRSNYPFIDGSGSYQLGTQEWFPGDDWRGDIARMIMYLNIRYGETFDKVGGLDLFIAWNIVDPVSSFEEQRNEVIYGAQGNRNPFIDNPYLATLIWGGDDAENKWN